MICEIMPLLNPLTVFGVIFLIMTIYSRLTMKTKINNPNCPSEVKAVKTNWKLFPFILTIDIVLIIAGIILYLV